MKKLILLLLTIVATICFSAFFTGCEIIDKLIGEESETPTVEMEYFTAQGEVLTGLTIDGKKLENVVVPETINGVKITTIGDKAFYDAQKIKTVKLPNTISVIGKEAFYGCKNMTKIDLSSNITVLDEWAFYGCSSLKSIEIPTGISEIKDNTFRECRSLDSISLPSNITKIGKKAFEKCIALTNVHLPSSITFLDDDAFTNCNGVTAFSVDSDSEYFKAIDGNLYSKDGKTFLYYALAKTAKTFTVPEGVETLGYASFANEMELETVNVASTVKSLGYECFSACQNLQFVTFGGANSRLHTIGHRAFFNAVKLFSIEAPETLRFVGSYAFSYCAKLSKVYSYLSLSDWDSLSINTPADNSRFTNASIREYM